MKCWSNNEAPIEDSQQHLLSCQQLNQTENYSVADYDDIFGAVEQQLAVTQLFMEKLDLRRRLLLEASHQQGKSTLDPST